MISNYAFLLLSSALLDQLTHASASPLDHSHRAVYRRADASDDDEHQDYREAAKILHAMRNDQPAYAPQALVSVHVPLLASSPLISQENPLDHSDEESIHFPDRKRRKISTESDALNGLKTTGLDDADASNEDNSRSSSKPGDNDDQSNAQADERGNN